MFKEKDGGRSTELVLSPRKEKLREFIHICQSQVPFFCAQEVMPVMNCGGQYERALQATRNLIQAYRLKNYYVPSAFPLQSIWSLSVKYMHVCFTMQIYLLLNESRIQHIVVLFFEEKTKQLRDIDIRAKSFVVFSCNLLFIYHFTVYESLHFIDCSSAL